MCTLCIQPLRFELRIIGGKQLRLEAAVTRGRVVLAKASGASTIEAVGQELGPACRWDLGDGRRTAGDIRMFEAHRWRHVARRLDREFRIDAFHGCEHADSDVVDLDIPLPLESGNVVVTGEAQRVPEADRGLHPEFVLESSQGRVGVECPITVGQFSKTVPEELADEVAVGRISATVPEEHADEVAVGCISETVLEELADEVVVG
mmetsp:Transcript_38511/g.111242  ORF Transcript_38511/g.111242 Transcript_38511/m.111242 type:complete len:206 (+) Transcript_38511:277-894(+)